MVLKLAVLAVSLMWPAVATELDDDELWDEVRALGAEPGVVGVEFTWRIFPETIQIAEIEVILREGRSR